MSTYFINRITIDHDLIERNIGVGALQHAVARYFGADYLCQAVWHKTVDKAVDGLVYTVEPTIHSHESVFNIGTEHHALSPKLVEPCLKEFGLGGSHTAHHSIARPGPVST